MGKETEDFSEIQSAEQAEVSDEELLFLARHPYASSFLLEKLDDIDTLADPQLQESIRQMKDGELIDITPKD